MSHKYIGNKFVKFGKLQSMLSPKDISEYEEIPFRVTEKIDGGNCQIRKIEGQLVAGSRANFLYGARLKSRPWFEKLNSWMHRNHSLFALPENLVVFGEWSGNHTIDYETKNNLFFLLGIFDMTTHQSLPYDLAQRRLEDLVIEDVNPLKILSKKAQTAENLQAYLNAPSDYYSGPKEGIVIANPELRLSFKLYHPDFADKIMTESGQIDYLTPSRFRKAIFYLVDEERKDKISPRDVVERVAKDVYDEEGMKVDTSILYDRFFIHFESGKLMKAANALTFR